jgi:hypothetical protein
MVSVSGSSDWTRTSAGARPRGACAPPPVSLRPVTEPTAEPGQAPDPAHPADGDAARGADPTPPRSARPTGPVQYRGEDLVPERGPGLGCFRIQVVVLAIFIVLTPLTVAWNWPVAVSAGLLFAVIGLLLVTGQTIIFLLRLVAADRRGRRRPLASGSKTVGELEDAPQAPEMSPADVAVAPPEDPDLR